MKNLIYISVFLFYIVSMSAFSSTEQDAIKSTLNNYIQGSSYNDVARLSSAFYADANLYLKRKEQPMWVVPSKTYVSWFEKNTPGEFNNRIGEILSIDVAGDIANAKVEIIMTKSGRRFVDLFLLKKISGDWKIVSKAASYGTSNLHGNRILFIVSSAVFHGNTKTPAGTSFSEIINAYDTFKKAGYTIDFVSPNGGDIALAYINTSNPQHRQYLYNPDFMYALGHTKKPSDITPENYKAVHYVGGSNAMYGVADNKAIQAISMEIYEKHKGIVSAVCHGTAGIVNLKTSDGKYLVSGKTISGFPEAYESQYEDYFKQFPFHIQKTIEQRGGKFVVSKRNKPHVEVDGRIITGQNHLSSALVAERIIELLAKETR